MLTIFINIPKELLQDSVVSFFEIVDVVRFDSALLNHDLRRRMDRQLNGALIPTQSIKMDLESAQWLIKRQMRASALNIKGTVKDLAILKHLAGSETISLRDCNSATPDDLVDFLHLCAQVKSLSMNGQLNGAVLDCIATNCKKLQSFSLIGNESLCAANLTTLTVGCRKLTEINLYCCYKWVNDACIETIALNCRQLQRLRVDNCIKCGDRAMQVLAYHCRDLRYLSIAGWRKLTDEGTSALAACTELRTLFLTSTKISSLCIAALAQSFVNLEEIRLPSLFLHIDLAIEALALYCPALKVLQCDSSGCTDTSLEYLQRAIQLTTLILHGAHISIKALLQLLRHCTNMQLLDLNSSRFTSNLASAAEPLAVPVSTVFCQLRSINLTSPVSCTDAPFVALLTQCPNVTDLIIHDCSVLTDIALCAIAKSCPNLRDLDISFCPEITDAGVVEVIQKCRQLQELDLRGCDQLSSVVLDAVLLYGDNLRNLGLSRCDSIDDGVSVERFQAAKPQCECVFSRPG